MENSSRIKTAVEAVLVTALALATVFAVVTDASAAEDVCTEEWADAPFCSGDSDQEPRTDPDPHENVCSFDPLVWVNPLTQECDPDYDPFASDCPIEERSARGYCPDDAERHLEEIPVDDTDGPPMDYDLPEGIDIPLPGEQEEEVVVVTTGAVSGSPVAAADALPATGPGMLTTLLALGAAALVAGVTMLRRWAA